MSVGDAPAGEVVGRHLHGDAVALQDADAEPAQLPRDGGEYFGAVVERDAERGAREHLGDRSLELDQVFLGDGVLLRGGWYPGRGTAFEINRFPEGWQIAGGGEAFGILGASPVLTMVFRLTLPP